MHGSTRQHRLIPGWRISSNQVSLLPIAVPVGSVKGGSRALSLTLYQGVPPRR